MSFFFLLLPVLRRSIIQQSIGGYTSQLKLLDYPAAIFPIRTVDKERDGIAKEVQTNDGH